VENAGKTVLTERCEQDVNVIHRNNELAKVVPVPVEVAQRILHDLTVVRIVKRARAIACIQPVLNPLREESKELLLCSLIVWLWMAIDPYSEILIPLSELRLR
jgi:hypothetical protein